MTNITDTEPRYPVGYLLFKKVRIHNANSISSPITYGLPAITGFLGAFHAMSRELQVDAELNECALGGVLLACYDCEPQVYRTSRYSNYTFNQSRNPIKKDGKTASIIEEGKCHLTMSFVVEVLSQDELSDSQQKALVAKANQWIQQQRIAGGSVQSLARFEPVSYIDYEDIDTVIPQLMPAFVLMDGKDEFVQIIDKLQKDKPETTPLDALLDISTIHHIPENKSDDKSDNKIEWHIESIKDDLIKTGHGWLVPMPIGYQGISERFDAGVMQNVRNPEYPSQYVEAIYGLGKWLYPTRIKIEEAFWRYEHDEENNLYLTTQTNPFEF